MTIPARTVACQRCGATGEVGYQYQYATVGQAYPTADAEVQAALEQAPGLSHHSPGGPIPASIPVTGGWTLPKGFSRVILCDRCKEEVLT